jgi:hypothetical protein
MVCSSPSRTDYRPRALERYRTSYWMVGRTPLGDELPRVRSPSRLCRRTRGSLITLSEGVRGVHAVRRKGRQLPPYRSPRNVTIVLPDVEAGGGLRDDATATGSTV